VVETALAVAVLKRSLANALCRLAGRVRSVPVLAVKVAWVAGFANWECMLGIMAGLVVGTLIYQITDDVDDLRFTDEGRSDDGDRVQTTEGVQV
jgi:NhaP-type Na+/H+ or K+/H+ antiporter